MQLIVEDETIKLSEVLNVEICVVLLYRSSWSAAVVLAVLSGCVPDLAVGWACSRAKKEFPLKARLGRKTPFSDAKPISCCCGCFVVVLVV